MEQVDSILNPTVYLGSLEFREPVTTLTDFAVALLCLFAFFSLGKKSRPSSPSLPFYRTYFLCIAIGLLSAAWIGHAFQAYFSYEWKALGWVFGIIGHAALAMASLSDARGVLGDRWFQLLRGLIILLFASFLIWIASPMRSFQVTQLASGTFIAGFALPLHLYRYWKLRSPGSLLIITAACYGILPAIVYNQQISLNRWFNYHDISHVLMFGFMMMMFLGVRSIQEVAVERSKHLST